ncbi:MAG: hypothetical protein ABI432_04655 [Flavobacteriales bacterium]
MLLLLFLFWKIVTPIPPFPEGGGMGMSIDLGYSDVGMGENDDMEPSPSESAIVPVNDQEEQLLTEDDPETPITRPEPKEPAVKPVKDPVVKPVHKPTAEEQQRDANNRMNQLYNTPGNGGQGNTGQPGNVGNPNGTPGGDGSGIGTGTGHATGPGWDVDLAGRTIKKKPTIPPQENVSGRVVLDIWVNPDGQVVRVVRNIDKSTTMNEDLFERAKRAAMGSSFYPNPKALGDQKGTMTFTFVL